MARAGRVASNALIAEIRLVWWREVVDEIFTGRIMRAHPVARRLAQAVRRRSLPRAPLEAMIDARVGDLEVPRPDPVQAIAWADAVGGSVTTLAVRILDDAAPRPAAASAGRAWGLVLLRRAGRIDLDVIERPLRESLVKAREDCRGLGVASFPAVAHVTLGRADLGGAAPSGLANRLRLLRAVASGRL